MTDAALTDVAAAWRGLRWELLPETDRSPAENVALDEVLLHRAVDGRRGPTLRFWGWAAPAVIIGRFQSLRNEVDPVAAQEMKVEVVRRVSGGGAMFVQPGLTITYSLIFPETSVRSMTIADSYAVCDRWVVDALRALGVEAFYRPLNDIACSHGKIGGAAQVRRGGQVLHHTTIAYEMNPHDMLRVLRIGREKLADKGTPSAAKHVHPLRRQTDLPRTDVVERLTAAFRERFGLTGSAVTDEEAAEAVELVRAKFATAKWTGDIA